MVSISDQKSIVLFRILGEETDIEELILNSNNSSKIIYSGIFTRSQRNKTFKAHIFVEIFHYILHSSILHSICNTDFCFKKCVNTNNTAFVIFLSSSK